MTAETSESYKRHGEHQMIDYAQRMRKRAEDAEAKLQKIREWADRRLHPVAYKCSRPYTEAQDEVLELLEAIPTESR